LQDEERRDRVRAPPTPLRCAAVRAPERPGEGGGKRKPAEQVAERRKGRRLLPGEDAEQ